MSPGLWVLVVWAAGFVLSAFIYAATSGEHEPSPVFLTLCLFWPAAPVAALVVAPFLLGRLARSWWLKRCQWKALQ